MTNANTEPRPRALLLAASLALLLAGCPAPNGGPWTPGGGSPFPGQSTRPDGGSPDETDGDGGSTPCPDDSDGIDAAAPLVVSELLAGPGGWLEIHAPTEADVDLANVTITGSTGSLPLPQEPLASGDRRVVTANLPADGELVVRIAGIPAQYLCWGRPFSTPFQPDAITLGTWSGISLGQCAPSSTSGETIHLRGLGTRHDDWILAPPTPLGCTD